jgi:hypothetical protein
LEKERDELETIDKIYRGAEDECNALNEQYLLTCDAMCVRFKRTYEDRLVRDKWHLQSIQRQESSAREVLREFIDESVKFSDSHKAAMKAVRDHAVIIKIVYCESRKRMCNAFELVIAPNWDDDIHSSCKIRRT